MANTGPIVVIGGLGGLLGALFGVRWLALRSKTDVVRTGGGIELQTSFGAIVTAAARGPSAVRAGGLTGATATLRARGTVRNTGNGSKSVTVVLLTSATSPEFKSAVSPAISLGPGATQTFDLSIALRETGLAGDYGLTVEVNDSLTSARLAGPVTSAILATIDTLVGVTAENITFSGSVPARRAF